MVKGGIAFVLARWQQQFAIACFGWGFDPEISPFPGKSGTKHHVSLDPQVYGAPLVAVTDVRVGGTVGSVSIVRRSDSPTAYPSLSYPVNVFNSTQETATLRQKSPSLLPPK